MELQQLSCCRKTRARKHSEVERHLQVKPIGIGGSAIGGDLGDGFLDVPAGEEVGVAELNFQQGVDLIFGEEIQLGADKAAEGRVFCITITAAGSAGFRIEGIVVIGQPEEEVVRRDGQSFDGLGGERDTRAAEIPQADEIGYALKAVVGAELRLEGFLLVISGIGIPGSVVVAQAEAGFEPGAFHGVTGAAGEREGLEIPA